MKVQPLAGDVQGEVVQAPDTAVDRELPVADVEVVELETADRAGPGGMH
ncbi:hypothetical protein [Streptomyces acidicola]